MKKLLLAASLALAPLAGCAEAVVETPPPGAISAAERCDASGTADSRALCRAWELWDVALFAVDGLVAVGALVPGSPKALLVQAGIREVTALLQDASAIQRGVRSGNLSATLARADAAIARVKAALAN